MSKAKLARATMNPKAPSPTFYPSPFRNEKDSFKKAPYMYRRMDGIYNIKISELIELMRYNAFLENQKMVDDHAKLVIVKPPFNTLKV